MPQITVPPETPAEMRLGRERVKKHRVRRRHMLKGCGAGNGGGKKRAKETPAQTEVRLGDQAQRSARNRRRARLRRVVAECLVKLAVSKDPAAGAITVTPHGAPWRVTIKPYHQTNNKRVEK